MRYLLTDDRWTVLEPIVIESNTHAGGARPRLSDRLFLEAVLYVARTSIPWRDLPAEFGAWDTVYARFRRWVYCGRFQRIFEALTANPDFGDVRRVFLDSTVIRAHMHAGGARRKKSISATKRRGNDKVWGGLVAASRRKSS